MIDYLHNKALSGELLTESEMSEYTTHIKLLLEDTPISQYFGTSDFSNCKPIVLFQALSINKQNLINCPKNIRVDIANWFTSEAKFVKQV